MTFVPPDLIAQLTAAADCEYCVPGCPCVLHPDRLIDVIEEAAWAEVESEDRAEEE